MEKISAFLSHDVFTLMGQAVSVADLVVIPAVLLIGHLLIRWLGVLIVKRLQYKKKSADIIHLARRVFYIVAYALLFITLLDLINVPITAFAFVSGAIAIGIGFGAQNIINNFISGWILMWERPIRIGDFLEVGADRGTVESIDTRSTRIRRVDGVHMLIPNSYLLENTVVNWTLIDKLTRSIVRVGVAYGSPTKRVKELLMQATVEQSAVLQDPKPLVIFEDFADSSLVFDIYFWVYASVDRDMRVIRSDIRFRIDELLAENQIVIAFPQRDVHIDGAIRIENSQSGDNHEGSIANG